MSGGGRPGSSATPPPRRSGGWFTAFLTLIFAIVALAAAAVSVGGPSYRSEIRKLIVQYVPQLDADVVDLVTGYDRDRLEVTYDGLDQRIEQLSAALERVAAAEGVSPEDARALLFRDQVALKLDDVSTRLDTLASKVDAVVAQTTSQAEEIAAVGADLEATTGRLESGLTGKIEAFGTEIATATATVSDSVSALRDDLVTTREALTALGARMDTAEARVDDQAVVDTAMLTRLSGLDERLASLVSDFTTLLDLNEQVAATVATFKTENMPILAIMQLREAVNGSKPYVRELAFADKVLNGEPGIRAALTTLGEGATDGIASIPELRRDLRLIATNLGSFVTKVESWAGRVTGWFNMMVGGSTVPEARPGGTLVASVATIDDALERNDMQLVMREATILLAEHRSTALADWLAAVNQRFEVIEAVGSLEDVVYKRTTAPAKGASQAQ